MMLELWVWLGSLVATALFILASVLWFDKPVAILVHELFGSRPFPAGRLADSPGLSAPLMSACIFVLFGLAAIARRRFSKFEWAVLLCDIGVLATEAIKDQLKLVFGRTWPDSWAPAVASLIRDNEYGFHFFRSGLSYQSFPSGHAAVVATVMTVLWILYPKGRAVYALCICIADVALVLLNLHFVSDVVAGTFVGASTGLFTVTLCAPAVRIKSNPPVVQETNVGV
jgi:membrane-associated phospholipid phosphatase